jgi:hypothetical protein
MNCRTFFDASVFPEPDSPEQTHTDQAYNTEHWHELLKILRFDQFDEEEE